MSTESHIAYRVRKARKIALLALLVVLLRGPSAFGEPPPAGVTSRDELIAEYRHHRSLSKTSTDPIVRATEMLKAADLVIAIGKPGEAPSDYAQNLASDDVSFLSFVAPRDRKLARAVIARLHTVDNLSINDGLSGGQPARQYRDVQLRHVARTARVDFKEAVTMAVRLETVNPPGSRAAALILLSRLVATTDLAMSQKLLAQAADWLTKVPPDMQWDLDELDLAPLRQR